MGLFYDMDAENRRAARRILRSPGKSHPDPYAWTSDAELRERAKCAQKDVETIKDKTSEELTAELKTLVKRMCDQKVPYDAYRVIEHGTGPSSFPYPYSYEPIRNGDFGIETNTIGKLDHNEMESIFREIAQHNSGIYGQSVGRMSWKDVVWATGYPNNASGPSSAGRLGGELILVARELKNKGLSKEGVDTLIRAEFTSHGHGPLGIADARIKYKIDYDLQERDERAERDRQEMRGCHIILGVAVALIVGVICLAPSSESAQNVSDANNLQLEQVAPSFGKPVTWTPPKKQPVIEQPVPMQKLEKSGTIAPQGDVYYLKEGSKVYLRGGEVNILPAR